MALLLILWGAAVQGSLKSALSWIAEKGAAQTLAQGVSQLVGFGLATWVVAFGPLGLGKADLRWAPPSIGVPGLRHGLLLGALPAALALVLSLLVGQAGWVRDEGSLVDYGARVALTTAILIPAALSEEVIFRGVPMVIIGRVAGRWFAIISLALLFGLAHFFNPEVTLLGIGNIVLAGILLGTAFFAPGGLWTAFGTHLGWNATLAALDAPVSGLPFAIPFLDYHPGGPAWLTGGRFGPEGGLLATLVITAAIVVAWRWSRRDNW